MSDLDLNIQCPSPLQSVHNHQSGSQQSQSFVDYATPPSHVNGNGFGNQGGFAGTGGGPMMYSESYPPQGTVFLGQYSNPALAATWQQFNTSHQGIK